jgi:hypothetical protein
MQTLVVDFAYDLLVQRTNLVYRLVQDSYKVYAWWD